MPAILRDRRIMALQDRTVLLQLEPVAHLSAVAVPVRCRDQLIITLAPAELTVVRRVRKDQVVSTLVVQVVWDPVTLLVAAPARKDQAVSTPEALAG